MAREFRYPKEKKKEKKRDHQSNINTRSGRIPYEFRQRSDGKFEER